MADIRIVKTGSDTYSVTKDGKTYTAKDTDGDGKLTAKDGGIELSSAEWNAVVGAQSNPVKSAKSSSVSVFSSQYEPAENIWQYDTHYAGRTISYPMDSLAAFNDSQVWNYANSVNNGWNTWLMQMHKLTDFLKAYDAETMKLWAEIFKIKPKTEVTETEKTEKEKEKQKTEDTEEITKLKKEVEQLKKELTERSTVKSYRDSLKDTGEFDMKVQNIAEKLKDGMKGINWLGVFGNVGGDKRVADAMNEITPENVVEVMEYYKTEICDKGYMGDDYNLVESIYDDFNGKKYKSKISHLETALTQRAEALIADYGEKCPITQAEIDKFKADVESKKGDSEEIPKVFEDFKNRLKKAEGGIERKITPKKKDETTATTTTKSETTTSSSSSTSQTSSSSETKKKEEEKKEESKK